MRALILSFFLAGCPKPTPPISVETSRDITVEVLNQWTREVCELIEAESGGSFSTVPHVRLATPTEIRQVVIDETVTLERIRDPSASERALRAAFGEQPIYGIMGKYGIFTDVMYVDTDTVWQVAAGVGDPVEHVERVTKVLLAHELTHALQAQFANASPTWSTLPDADALEAFRSVTEGQATWVEARVGTRLASDDIVQVMIEAQGWSFEEGAVHPGAFRIWSAYGQGAVWMASLHEAGGTELQWEAVRRPPHQTAVVFGSKPYPAEPTVVPDGWRDQFRGLERKLGQGAWAARESVLGELALREALFYLQEELTPHLTKVEFAWARDAELPDRKVSLQRIRFVSDEAAASFLDLLQSRPEDRPHERISNEELADGGVRVLSAPGARDSGISSAAQEVQTTWVRAGQDILVLKCARFRPGLRNREVLTAMLALVEDE
jgi:hypothetical protein